MSQARAVSAQASNPNGTPSSNSAEAPDFATFNRTVSAASQGLGPGDITRSQASQNSAIATDRISGSLDTLALFSEYNGSGTAQATSTVDVTFDLPDGGDYQLFNGSSGTNFFGRMEVTLSGPDGVINHFPDMNSVRSTLAPGRYRLEVLAISVQADDAFEGRHGGSFDFHLVAPPAVIPKYSLAGRFGFHQSGIFDLPLVGATPCPSHTVMSGPGGPGGMVPAPTTPPNRTQTQPANPLGCVPNRAGKQINQSAVGSRGTVQIPAGALYQSAPDDVNWLAVPNATPLVQVQTSLAFFGPQAAAVLRPDAWTKQAGRAAADFTWCPGNSACAKITEGTKPAIVKYTAGPNGFGGTMQMVIAAGSRNPSRSVQAPGAGAGPVTFLPFAALGARPTGAGYAFKKTDPAVSGSGFALHMSTAMGRISMGTGYLGPRPGTEVMNYGFPFTTGRVLVRRTGTQLGNPVIATTSAVGSDHVTSMGARNLSLVAGAVAVSQLGGPSLAIAQLSLPEPRALAQQLAGVAALLAIAVWRACRHRA